MRLLGYCSLFVLLFSFIACEQEHAGSFNVEGYCYDTCGGSPLANYRVRFSHYDRFFESYSDSSGYFKLAGSFNYAHSWSKKPDPGFINFTDTSRTSDCCYQFELFENAAFKGDTIYGYNTIQSVLRVTIDASNNTNVQDTLFLSSNFRDYDGTALEWFRSDTETYSITYNYFYVGPFYEGQILDTLEFRVGAHVGHDATFGSIASYDFRGPNIGSGGDVVFDLFEHGQDNISCDHVETMIIDLNEE